ncbi:MAG: shikimate kinase [Crocinitomicaceae bacterium]|nr:shikimate kinase [Crocinitomicaceae bacterium]
MNIILIGYMGVGKTSLGKRLANRLEMEFVDTDQLIETREGCSIETIFANKGESYFRKLEQEVVNELRLKDNLLISTGGGMPCFNNLMGVLNDMGLTIYLKRSAKELANRLIKSKKKRPLVVNKNYNELVTFIDEMLIKRAPYYEAAQIVADRTMQTVTDLELQINDFKNK